MLQVHFQRGPIIFKARGAVPGGYQYSRFCERYGRWLATSSVTLRQEHRVFRVSVEASSFLTALSMAFTPFPPD